jgi:hypothetical protein
MAKRMHPLTDKGRHTLELLLVSPLIRGSSEDLPKKLSCIFAKDGYARFVDEDGGIWSCRYEYQPHIFKHVVTSQNLYRVA